MIIKEFRKYYILALLVVICSNYSIAQWTSRSGGLPEFLSFPLSQNFIATDSMNAMLATRTGIYDEVYNTFDGGKSWQKLNLPTIALHTNFMSDNKNLWVCGKDYTNNKSVILKSLDGGVTWEEKFATNVSLYFEYIKFFDSRMGICKAYINSNYPDPIYVTNDGGENWENANNKYYLGWTEHGPNSIDFVDYKNGFIVPAFDDLYKTTDMGEHWDSVFYQYDLETVDFYDKNLGVICSESGDIFLTKDGGKNWIQQSTKGHTPFFIKFQPEDASRIWISYTKDTFGRVAVSLDTGKTWIDQTPDTTLRYFDMEFASGGAFLLTENEVFFNKNISNLTSDVKDDFTLPEFRLFQNYPNPFNPETKIEYSLNKSENVEIIIYDILGKIVAKLIEEYQLPGNHSISFDTNNLDKELTSGIYFYRLKAGKSVKVKKMLLLK